MPYTFNSEEGGVSVNFYGDFCFKDNTEATIELYSHPKFSSLKYIIWNFSDVSKMDMTKVETDSAALMDKEASMRLPYTKVVLVTQKPFIKKLCAEYIAQCQNRGMRWNFLIADNIEAARIWIAS